MMKPKEIIESEYLTIEEATATTVSFIRRALTSYDIDLD